MTKYLMVKLVFGEEIHPDVYSLMQDEYEKACCDIGDYAASLGAKMLVEDSVNVYGTGHSYAAVEHNFPMTREEKESLLEIISRFFVDGAVEARKLKTFNVLSAVRFLQTEGELFEV